MSEASMNVEHAIEAVADAVAAPSEIAAEVAASVEQAVPVVKPVKQPVTKSVAVAAPAKRKYKQRAKRAAAPVLKAAPKTASKAATPVRRKYNRKSPAAPVAATPIEGVKKMTTEIPNWFAGFTAAPSANKLQTMFAGAGEKSQDVVRKGQAMAEQMTEATRANVEAVVESSRIAVAGVRDIGQEVVASTKGGVEHASAAVKTLTEAKSPTEFFQLQSEIMRSSFDRMVAESSKLTEHMVKLAGEAIQPLSNRASVSAEKFSELTA